MISVNLAFQSLDEEESEFFQEVIKGFSKMRQEKR